MKVNVKEFIPQRKSDQFQRAYQGLLKVKAPAPRKPSPSETEGAVDEGLTELVRSVVNAGYDMPFSEQEFRLLAPSLYHSH